jgi:Fe-S-cluster-containing hydrogenase component 2
VPLFDGLPNDVLLAAIGSGELTLRSWIRDDIIADAEVLRAQGPQIYLVKSGQVAVAVFPREALDEERAWAAESTPEERLKKVRSAPPLIRRAEKNLATFGEGDLYNSAALQNTDVERMAFYAVEPSEIIVVSPRTMGLLTSRYGFFAQRLRRAIEVARGRLSGIQGIKQEIFDFYVRHGLSVAETLRVRQIDRCIECKECEKACESRYGHKRLAIKGPTLGMLDFVYTCRTCTDQRCVDPCNYASITFDKKRREVLINEATCTGCAACAEACPYGSIEMVDLQDPSKRPLKARLEGAGALSWGEGTTRKAQLVKIASKCDHCQAFTDQACISHCPTGALIEIKPTDLFQDKSEIARKAARAGFDQTVIVSAKDMLPEDPFRKGLGITDFADAKVKRGRISPALTWGIGVGAFLLALAEIVLRLWKPTWSLQYFLHRLDGLEPAIAQLKVGYRPGSELAVLLGYVGTGLLLVTMLYPLRKRIGILQRIATGAAWFDVHLMAGFVGPAFVTLHSALKLDLPVSSFAYWSMAVVVLSGIIGRYLTIQVPEILHGRELEELEHERALARLRASAPEAVAVLDGELAAHRVRAMQVSARSGLLGSFGWVLADDLRRPFRAISWRLRLRGTTTSWKLRRQVLRHAGRLMLAARRRVLVPRTTSVLHRWKMVHVTFTFILAVGTIVHVVLAVKYSM